jgi:hypothetical protein
MKFCLTALSLLLAGSACAEEAYSAKALFFGEDDAVVAVSTTQKDKPTTTAVAAVRQDSPKKGLVQVANKKPADPQSIGASYFIRLKNPDGSTNDVLTSRKFKSGERFQLGVKVNRPSYIYIYNEDPNGKVTQVYPQPGRDNFVNAMGVVFLPSQGAFEFDQEPGVEKLLVYVSKTAVPNGMQERIQKMRPDVVTAAHGTVSGQADASCNPSAETSASTAGPAGTQVAMASNRDYASKAIAFVDDTACIQSAAKGESYASKGIAFTDDASPSPSVGTSSSGFQPASYVVKKATTPDASLFMKIKLIHQ